MMEACLQAFRSHVDGHATATRGTGKWDAGSWTPRLALPSVNAGVAERNRHGLTAEQQQPVAQRPRHFLDRQLRRWCTLSQSRTQTWSRLARIELRKSSVQLSKYL